MDSFLYCWTDNDTNMIYVGVHKGTPEDGYVCSSKYMMEEYNQRPQSFTRQIIAQGNYADMVSLETAILKSCDAGTNPDFYNRHTNNGQYSLNGHSEETKQKMSKAKIGQSRSKKSRVKQSSTMSGEGNHFFGKTHTEEAKAKMSKAKKDKYSGVNHPCARRVRYNGVEYGMMKDAAKAMGVNMHTLRKEIAAGSVEVL